MAGTYHYVITLQWPLPGGGVDTCTHDGLYTAEHGVTREQAYREILAHTLDQVRARGVTTTSFSLEPNAL